MFIKEVRPEIIENSNKEKTIQIEIQTYKGVFKASAPSGKSKGRHEVSSYSEKGISHSLKILNILIKKILNKNFMMRNLKDLRPLEEIIKSIETKYGKMGGNFVYALETCFLKAAAKDVNKQLWEFISDSTKKEKTKPKIPLPVGNCIGGGLHSKKNKNSKEKVPDFQEFLLIPNLKRGERFSRAITKNLQAYDYAKRLIKKKERKIKLKRDDENAWKTSLTNEEVLDILYEVGKKYNLKIGVDLASSVFCRKDGYYLYKNKSLIRDRLEQIDYIQRLIKKYGLFYVEDPLQEEDFPGFAEILESVNPEKTLIIGDDLTVTKFLRARTATRSKAINSIIIKPNQVGSILEVEKVVEHCKENNLKMIFSHRAGETMDDALADYCVGFGGDFIKCGILGRERLIKLKRIVDIEKALSL